MVPAAVLVQAMDEVDGGLVVLCGGEHEHGVRFRTGDGCYLVRQMSVHADIVARADDELSLGVVLLVSTLRPVHDAVAVVEEREPDFDRSIDLRLLFFTWILTVAG